MMASPRQQLTESVRRVILANIERRPISDEPDEGTVSMVDDGSLERWGDRRACATFRGGRWRRANGGDLPFEPTIWLGLRQ